jgi:hypothetical protein
MEIYLPIVKALYEEWLALTLNNPVYAGEVAGAVFLVTAMVYGFRISSLKRAARANEKAHQNEQANLNATLEIAQQQLQSMQEVLTANTEQIQKVQQTAQKEAEKAKKLEEQLTQRNTQIGSLIQSLATRFDLGERPLPVMGDVKAEGLWQQHERVVDLIATRLVAEQQAKTQLQESYQSEKIKTNELQVLTQTLQETSATQVSQLSKLEQALDDQKAILKIQQDKAEQILAETVERNQVELARIPALEQQLLSLANAQQQVVGLTEALKAKETLIAQIEKDQSATPLKQDTPVITVSTPVPEPAVVIPSAVQPAVPVEIKVPEPIIPETPVVADSQETLQQEPKASVASKFKGLFGKNNTNVIDEEAPVAPEPVVTERSPDVVDIEPEPESLFIEEQAVRPVKEESGSLSGKFKGLFGKNKAAPIEDAVAIDTVSPVVPESVIAVEEPQVETTPQENQAGLSGKFKGFFGKNKATVNDVEPEVVPVEIVPEVVAAQEPELEFVLSENQAGPIDTIKEDVAKVKAKLKGLFGK